MKRQRNLDTLGPSGIWYLQPECHLDHLGLIPAFLSADDQRPAKEQLHANYLHGGGWRPQSKWRVRAFHHTVPPRSTVTQGRVQIQYPGDPVYMELARYPMPKHGETVCVFQYAIVGVFQDRDPIQLFEISRMD